MSDERMSIPEQIESRFYEPDTTTDTVLFDGRELAEGMMVLVEDYSQRWSTQSDDPGIVPDAGTWLRIRTFNRWCKILHLVIDEEGKRVRFTAIYADGAVKKRDHNINDAWIVKRVSMNVERTDQYDIENPTFLKVLNLVLKGFHGIPECSPTSSENECLEHAKGVTRQILESI